MEVFALAVMIGLQAKHLAADYFLQSAWMLAGKGSLSHPGGYAHVGIHAAGTLVVLVVAGTAATLLLSIVLIEALVHYLIDFGKARWSQLRPSDVQSRAFWAAQGTDQFLHQVTYAVMLYVLVTAL